MWQTDFTPIKYLQPWLDDAILDIARLPCCFPVVVVALQLWTMLKTIRCVSLQINRHKLNREWLGAIIFHGLKCGIEKGQTHQNGLMDCDFVSAMEFKIWFSCCISWYWNPTSFPPKSWFVPQSADRKQVEDYSYDLVVITELLILQPNWKFFFLWGDECCLFELYSCSLTLVQRWPYDCCIHFLFSAASSFGVFFPITHQVMRRRNLLEVLPIEISHFWASC